MLGEIYRKITNFNGNKLINARTNTPTHNEDITNKKYVDDKQIFSTVKSKLYKIPFLFKWMGDVNNKTHTELFDELLFGSIPPEFIEGELVSKSINLKGELTVFNKLAENDATFNYEIKLNDRDKVISKRIISKYPDKIDSIVTIANGKLIDSVDIKLSNQNQIIFEVIYAPFVTKKTTTDEDYTPPNNANKTVEYVVYDLNGFNEVLNVNKIINTIGVELLYSSTNITNSNAIITKFPTINSLSDLSEMIPLTDSFLHTSTKGTYYYDNHILICVEKDFVNILDAQLIGINDDTFNQFVTYNNLETVSEKTINNKVYKLLKLNLQTKTNRTLFLTTY